MPEDYYALAEQRASEFEPDVLGLERRDDEQTETQPSHDIGCGGIAVATVPPKARLVGEVEEASLYAIKRRTVTIRHATNDRIVALLEIVSPGNKDRAQSVQRFIDEAVAALQSGYHLVVVDLFPPGSNDRAGLASAIWEAVGGPRIAWQTAAPLSAASFRVADRVQCYAEPFGVGRNVPELPLFYDPDWYVNLPLERTYAAAYEGVPRRWKQVIEECRSFDTPTD